MPHSFTDVELATSLEILNKLIESTKLGLFFIIKKVYELKCYKYLL